MCIVTFLPTAKGFIFTSNRDENILRKTLYPQYYNHHRQKLFYPKDLEKGGTWFAVDSTQKKVACLLNATGKQPQPDQRMSRGKITVSYLTGDNNFMLQDQLKKTAPFTLIILRFTLDIQIEEYLWDGKQLLNNKKNEKKPQLWCSNTLYSNAKKQQLTAAFEQHLLGGYKWEDLIYFHKKIAQPANSSEYLIKNHNIQTVSITSLNALGNSEKIHYSSLI